MAFFTLLANGSSDQCKPSIQSLTTSPPLWLSHHQDYLKLKDAFEEVASYLRQPKAKDFPSGAINLALAAMDSIKKSSNVYQRISENLRKQSSRALARANKGPSQQLNSSLTEILGSLGEILVSMGLWGVERVQASSSDLYPEKIWLDRTELRAAFPFLIGETDVIFRGRLREEALESNQTIRVGEVKSLVKSRKLNSDEIKQAKRYAEMAGAKSKLGYDYKIYYFFPLAAPSPESVKRLESMGITVIRSE